MPVASTRKMLLPVKDTVGTVILHCQPMRAFKGVLQLLR